MNSPGMSDVCRTSEEIAVLNGEKSVWRYLLFSVGVLTLLKSLERAHKKAFGSSDHGASQGKRKRKKENGNCPIAPLGNFQYID